MSLPVREHPRPDGWVVVVPDLPVEVAFRASVQAQALVKEMAPKVSGRGAASLRPAHGEGWFGLYFPPATSYMMLVNEGTKPRIMTSLAGKTIPMWINDPDGSMAADIRPQDQASRVRITEDGRRQVKIFRKAAPIGSTKLAVRRDGSLTRVPRAYPGAIKRGADGRLAGRYWRHPGTTGRQFAQDALVLTADQMGLEPTDLYKSKIGA